MTKTERQYIGVQRAYGNDYIGTLNYTMRFGKTITGINIIKNANRTNGIFSVIVLVPNANLRLQWENEISSRIKGIKVLVYTANIAQSQDLHCDLLIVDEIHKFISDGRVQLINGNRIKHTYRIGLTGTYPANVSDNTDVIYKMYPIIDVITEEEAIFNNWISDYVEYNYGLELPDYDRQRYMTYSDHIGEVLNTFRGTDELFTYQNQKVPRDHYTVITACRVGLIINKHILNSDSSRHIPAAVVRDFLAKEKGWYRGMPLNTEENRRISKYWSPENIESRVSMFEDYVRRRNELINNHQAKLEAVLNLVEHFKDKVTIIFNQSIDFADKLTEAINANFGNIAVCYHSKISSRPLLNEEGEYYRYKSGHKKGLIKTFGQKSLKDNAVNGIKQGHYKILVTVMALDEGFSVENLELAITTSGTTNPIQHKQRTARVKTLNPYKEKETMVVNLFFKHFEITNNAGESKLVRSRDQTKLIMRQKQSENLIHWVENVENIS